MTDLHARFRALDELEPPNLWTEIEVRAMRKGRSTDSSILLTVIAAAVLLIATIVGAASLRHVGVGGPVPEGTPGEVPPGQHATGAWTTTGSMAAPLAGPLVLLADGRVLAAESASELYDPRTGSWTATGTMRQARVEQSATRLSDGRVLVAGGAQIVGGVTGPEAASAEVYDPSTGQWTTTGPMLHARAGHTATLLADGRVLVAGGYVEGNPVSSLYTAELYDPGTGSWTATRPMNGARRLHVATLLPDGTVLVAGGSNGRIDLATAERYDPRTGSWTAAGVMRGAGQGLTATLLLDGTVLVVGSGGQVMYGFAELYDPRTGSWSTTGNMIEPRGYQSATLLPDGRVLVAGGANGTGDHHVTSTAELFDPTTGSWTATGSLALPRKFHAAILLSDGTVLVAGGTDGPTRAGWHDLTTAELYVLQLGD